MLIDVDKLPEEGLKVSEDFEYASFDLVEENSFFLKPVHIEGTVKKVGEEVWVKGSIATCLSCICSRCLTPFEFAVDSKFNIVFFPEEFEIIEEDLDGEDIDKLFYYNRHLNIRDVVLEQLNLAFPAKPLCSERCEGICPNCGRIRQSGRCNCAVKITDSRLEKLKIFLKG